MGRLHQHRSWRLVGALSAPGADPPEHECPAGKDIQYQAPGPDSRLWRSFRYHRPRIAECDGIHEPRYATSTEQVVR